MVSNNFSKKFSNIKSMALYVSREIFLPPVENEYSWLTKQLSSRMSVTF